MTPAFDMCSYVMLSPKSPCDHFPYYDVHNIQHLMSMPSSCWQLTLTNVHESVKLEDVVDHSRTLGGGKRRLQYGS